MRWEGAQFRVAEEPGLLVLPLGPPMRPASSPEMSHLCQV